ncbi:MAG TPA: sulfate adenylyltransferase subunit CysN [Steroidobacteraceae bacterium]|jgi:bifunctional enzyme CysN/CysC|nr:sulfate adenylyltransferase subunit CysN [Steroidobacteraceae bacterium]
MAHQSELIARDIGAYLHAQEHKSLLRFITCGSVDDGKSTLIGRLLYESKLIFDDQLTQLAADSRRIGTRGGELDFALLVDGLAAEREQGITIDVAYRFFSTERRKFIVADTPGHEQYTRNMVTGASTADLAVILVDARKGVLVQTRRHSYLVHLIGIPRVVLAVNKMDLVGYSAATFEEIVAQYREFAGRLGLADITPIPLSAVHGDNVITRSGNMPWYSGPTLLGHLETVEVDSALAGQPFRLPVQWVNRPNAEFRGFAGLIADGTVHRGDRLRVLPSGRESRVARIVTADGDLESATAGQSVTLTLDAEIDISRGDVLAAADAPPQVADQFEATIVWLQEEPMLQGRTYLMKAGTRMLSATVTPLKHRVNVNTLEHEPAERLELNDIGVCELELDRPIPFEAYSDSRALGGFILIDRLTNNTAGAGLINFALRRSQNVHWQALDVDKQLRARLKGQKACVLWLTGLSGAGKSTIANRVEKRLAAAGRHTYLLDGDNVRHGLNKDLGFTAQDRVENIRRVAEVARLMVDAGLIVLVSFISPFRSERRMARELFPAGEFFEVFVDTPLAEAERRDVKGLYRKARRGELKNFTGIDSPYERPENPEIRIDTTALSADEAAARVIAHLESRKVIGST